MKKILLAIGAAGTLAFGAIELALPQEFSDVSAVQQAEREYFAKTGEYLQVLPGNVLPPGESGTVEKKLGKKLPVSTRVDIYETPDGKKGYHLYYQDQGAWLTMGDGPEAVMRSATST